MNPRVRFEDEAGDECQNAGHVLDLPGTGQRVPRLSAELPVRRLGVRRFPYHVIYLETRDELRILAVAHDRRRPGYWRSRLK